MQTPRVARCCIVFYIPASHSIRLLLGRWSVPLDCSDQTVLREGDECFQVRVIHAARGQRLLIFP